MKTKTIAAILSLTLITSLIIFSCQKNEREHSITELEQNDNALQSLLGPSSGSQLGWSPEGSKINVTGDKTEVIAPIGWSYAFYNDQGGFFNLSSATKSISCTCNVKGDCRPFSANGPWGTQQGCLGTCTDCTMKQSLSHEGKIVNIESGGYYSTAMKTRLLKNGETAPAVFKALFEVPEFKKEFNSFIRIAHNGKPVKSAIQQKDGSLTAPMGYSLVAISIMGRGLAVVLPDEYVAPQLGEPTSGKASCSCNGTGSCKVKSLTILGTGSTWCESKNCSSCTLTITSLSPKQGNYQVHLNTYAL